MLRMLKTKRNEGEFEITYHSLVFPNTPNDSNLWGILNPRLIAQFVKVRALHTKCVKIKSL